MTEGMAPARARDGDFVGRLARFGSAPALLTGDEVVSYAELDARVEATADRLGARRRLVLLHGENTVGSVVSYLAALRGGHPVILVDGARGEQLAGLTARFDPDVIIGPDGWRERRPATRHRLHPELRLLLSTSGSTGSPKLVRLSEANLTSNAAAIADYLGLTPGDRALTTLPLAYSYGLSVLHSHLHAGASLVVTGHSVLDPRLWSLARSHAVTSFAAVPHTFALLDRSAEPWYDLASLRYVTCAGGRLEPGEVRRLAALGAERGWRLFVMYGQTEATARMAYLDPAEAGSHPDCVGRPVPGGALRVDQPDADGVGELVYSGPNVMMGYAEGPGDLARGPELTELRTGDLGRQRADGLFQVVGRTSRFAKLLGHRIDLDRLQSALTDLDPSLVCLSDDRRLLVAVTGADPVRVRDAATRLTGLPPGLVSVRRYAELPLLPNGKPDLAALRHPDLPSDRHADLQAAIRAAYAEVLGRRHVDPDSSFVELGGDSLSFVETAFRLEQLLGRLPSGWPQLSIRELAGGRAAASDQPSARPSRTVARAPGRWVAALDTGLVLRALAIVLVVLVHLKLTDVRGGAHLLLGAAGYTFARFPLAAVRASDRIGGLLRSIARFAVPSVLFIGLVATLHGGGYSRANVLLLNQVLGPPRWTEAWNFWFVEALVTILAGLAVLLSVPAVRQLERRHRMLLPALLLALGLLLRTDLWNAGETTLRHSRTHLVFWVFALGWLIQVSTGILGRLLVSAVVLATFAGYFPDEPTRGLVVQAGLLLLVWLPWLPVPRLLAPLVSRLASASLWIYLTHWVVWPPLLEAGVPRPVVAVGCLAVGVLAAGVVSRLEQGVPRLVRAWASARTGGVPAEDRRSGDAGAARPVPVGQGAPAAEPVAARMGA